METHRPGILEPHLPDDITIRHWLVFYVVFFLGLAVPLGLLIARQGWSLSDWTARPAETFARTSPTIKLLGLGLYVSLCTTFLPLPTGWIAAGVATRQAAVANGLSESLIVVALLTTLLVAGAGAIGSTVANLNDYHIFTWMLRHRRIAAVRNTRSYRSAAKWFSRSPFFLVLGFNIIPIPIDLVRMLATTYRYPRLPFAAANFIGRFLRYGAIAFVTYWWDLGKIAPIALLILAVVLGAGRLGPKLVRRIFARQADRSTENVSSA